MTAANPLVLGLAERRIGDDIPGTAEWLQNMSASKVAAAIGLSPWQSPFSLHHLMAGNVAAPPQTSDQSRGHFLEPALVEWFRAQHPELVVQAKPGSFAHPDCARYTASPDGIVGVQQGMVAEVCALLEVKTAAYADEWLEGVPPYYAAQVQWQMFVTGVPRVYVVCLTSFLQFVEHVVEQDDTEIALILDAVNEFLTNLDAGIAPPIDGHSETYATVRRLHPDIDDVDVEIDAALAREFRTARAVCDLAKAEAARLTAQVADAIGSGKRAVVGPDRIAYRKAGKPGSAPFLQAYPVKELTP